MKIQLFPTKNDRKGPNVVQNLCTDNYANGSFFFIFSFFASRAMPSTLSIARKLFIRCCCHLCHCCWVVANWGALTHWPSAIYENEILWLCDDDDDHDHLPLLLLLHLSLALPPHCAEVVVTVVRAKESTTSHCVQSMLVDREIGNCGPVHNDAPFVWL